jgi:CRP/FNR family transcriptional regulator, cyclic AMP receptor protein
VAGHPQHARRRCIAAVHFGTGAGASGQPIRRDLRLCTTAQHAAPPHPHADGVKSKRVLTRVTAPLPVPLFDARDYLESAGLARPAVKFARNASVFRQGDVADHVMYIQSGGVKLSVVSKAGREAVVAMLGPGDFFGEGCLAGQKLRMGSATAVTPSAVLLVPKQAMVGLLHKEHEMSDRFIAHMLTRNIRIEEDLIDQLFNSSEKRLARALLLLARYGKQDAPARVVPRLSQETLAEMIGTTRSRVNFFLNKFKKLGFIEYDGDRPLKINQSLLSVVLHD